MWNDIFSAFTETYIPIGVMAVRLILAALFGWLVGWDRQAKRKPAGLRTHMLVAIGSASFVLIGLELMYSLSGSWGELRLDPMRVIEALVGGLGFLGAGTIIQARGTVEGVTTAAGIWVMGAIGAACGVGAYLLATFMGLMTFFVLRILSYYEHHLIPADVRLRRSDKDE